MHRQSLTDYGKPLQTTEAPTPVPAGTQVLVRISHCGVCHSDLHLQDGHFDLGGGQKRLLKTVQQSLGIPIHRYMEVDFVTFAGLVDAVGGITIGAAYLAPIMPKLDSVIV